MDRHEKPRRGARCVAPLGDVPHDAAGIAATPLCSAPATTTRVIENTVCPLCDEHAREIDEEGEGGAA